MPQVYVAVGSNVEPERHIGRALDALANEFAELRSSGWYRNRAVGFEGEDFINLVVGFATSLPVREVLARLHAIEEACGRVRHAPRWAPRKIDLDVLLYDDLVCEEPGLTLPRPDLLKRAYMLGPLAEIAPQAVHPTRGLSIETLWQQFDRMAHPLERVRAGMPTSPRSARRPPRESDR
jgi:2-amino-4-hydroxy-6-hydroxymethyldihydropteridine diphosphokinase